MLRLVSASITNTAVWRVRLTVVQVGCNITSASAATSDSRIAPMLQRRVGASRNRDFADVTVIVRVVVTAVPALQVGGVHRLHDREDRRVRALALVLDRGVVLALVDLDGRFLQANPALCAISGRSVEERQRRCVAPAMRWLRRSAPRNGR